MESHLFSMFKSFAQGIGGSPKKILLGICAMDKKAKSKPMQEILGRLPDDIFEVVIFGDDCILNQPIETWPEVECLIAFSSSKYPTEKALEYIELRKPFLVNDLGMDNVLRDRRKVYKTLLEHGIEVPKHVVLDREDPNVNNTVEEYDEYVIINGVQINKPLVEKPVDAEDHNVYIYYPMSAGGGSKRLFRKVNDRSSEFYPRENELRTSGSYIYEEFIITQGTDVKVYTVGPDYGHAEARKSPVVDGKVARDSSGMEVRYPVILTHEEKDLIRKITTAFRQTVCGFDILRVRDKSLVCDVNGWSFVKNSRKYYDDASKVLADYMISALRPKLKQRRPRSIKLMGNKNRSRSRSPFSDPEKLFMTNNPNSFASMNESIDSSEELRCVVAVIRHGDRTPKQKMKLNVQEPKYLAYFHQFAKSPRKDLKVKSKSALVRFLEVTREVLAEGRKSNPVEVFQKFKQIKDVLERWEISGINRKLQMKPEKWVDSVDENGVPTSQAIDIQMILKWGGDLTPLGREQSEGEGAYFRHHMYPDSEGGGVLRLHSTYRHDLKIKASDEGRVMKTAAAFTKGLLELEGPLTPILVSLVTVEEKNRQMLDKGGNCEIKEDMERCKKHIEDVLQRDVDVTDEFIDTFFPNCQTSIRTALHKLGNPRKALDRIHELIGSLCKQVEVLCQKTGEMEWHSNTDASEVSSESDYDQDADFKTLCLNETYSLMLDRWSKQNKDFKNKKTGMYDLTKVPDVYDMVRYDLIHNSHIGLKGIEELLQLAMAFADSVVPQEYGISKEDKISIGSKMCGALVEKMRDDLELVMMKTPNSDMSYALDHSHADDLDINSLSRNVRTRLYFTSESHLHTLLNVLRYPGPGIPSPISAEGLALLDETPELSYLTQIIIKLFEIENESGESSFRCEISFSPGAVNDCIIDKSSTLAPYVTLTNSIPAPEMINVLKAVIGQSAGGDSKVDSTVSVSTPNTSVPTTPSSKFSKKTSTETVVFSSNSFETSDTWEEPVSPVTVIPKKDRKLKKRINVITDTIAEESSPAEKRDGSGDAST